MRIPEQGAAADEVLARLDDRRGGDVAFDTGTLFSYVFLANDEARRVAEQAHHKYLWSNGLDPLAFPSLLSMEQEVVAMAADHLHGAPSAVGNMTSGGTESVMLALRTARDWARAERPHLARPQVVLPVTAHPCFHKGAQYFGLETVVTGVDPKTFRADAQAMADAVTDSTILVVGSAPSYAHGVVDPIPEIAALAQSRGILCHVDGCIGAFMLPFFRDLGADVPPFDFRVPGVTSISMDFHKYAFSPKGASVLLYRDDALYRHQPFVYSAWTGYPLVNPTMLSSKGGGPIAATWALLHHLGREGYLGIARELKQGFERMLQGIAAIPGLTVLGDPDLCLVAVASDRADVFHLCDAMKRRGWDIQVQLRLGALPANFHLTLMPRNLPHIDRWLEDLGASVEEVASNPPESKLGALSEVVGSLDFSALRGSDVAALLQGVGVGGGAGALSDVVGEVNALLDQLDPAQRDGALRAFYAYLLDEARPDR
jgi:sphinganine-1-phosphate aldolase